MEKLELKHLAPYLPYGLKTLGRTDIYPDPIITGILSSNNHVYWNYHGSTGAWKLEHIKPILRPLSDLSKSIQIAEFYASFIIHIKRITGFEIDIDLDIDSGYLQSSYIEFSDYQLMLDFLYEKHFDVFGLIEKGLAIDINTLEK